jgi:hypothetical protein
MMARHLSRRLLALGAVALAWAGLALPANAKYCCPFCSSQGKTLLQEVNDAALVVYGSAKGLKQVGGPTGEGTAELTIETVIKSNKILGNKKTLEIGRYTEDKKYRLIVFCDVFKGKLDPYNARMVLATAKADKYLLGALKVKDQSVPERLRFFFDYLDHDESEIANDAYKEFALADYKDVRKFASKINTSQVEKVVKWLKDEKTPGFRYGLYASIIGHAGGKKEAKLIRSMLDNRESRLTGTGLDGMLAAYIMLEPKEGWKYLHQLMTNTKQ